MEHVSVEVVGEGAPVILIPGLSSPRAVWEGVAPGLAKQHRVYLVQVNGFAGENPRANTAPGILAGIVADLHALVAQEKLHDAAVVGHSLGGLVGLMFAKAHPHDLARLMVVDALPYAGTIFVPNATVAMIEPQAAAIRDRMVASFGKPADEATTAGTAAALALKSESRAKVAGWMRASDPRVSGLAMYEDLTADLRPEMATIATPITVVYPWSAALPRERADAFYRGEYAKAPHVSYVDVGDAAHFVMLDQPTAFAAALEAFLK
jgi:pimeloyl-ACP methyl ester carboxylesterase